MAPFGWVSGVKLGLRQIQMLVSTNHQTIIQQLDDSEVIGSTNPCLCLPKAELNTKNSIEFLVFNLITHVG